MAWIVAQAMVNIGAVIGLLPVIGVPLPLVSRRFLLITTMGILGMLIAFARHEPDCAEQLAGSPSILRRSATVATSRGRRSGWRAGMTARSVLLAGGGTAGHVSPLLAGRLPAEGPGDHCGAGHGRRPGVSTVPAVAMTCPGAQVPLPRKPSADLLTAPKPGGLPFRAATAIGDIDADVVVRGVPDSATCLDSRLPCCSSAVHEPIVVPRRTRDRASLSASAPFHATHVAVTFPDTPSHGAVVTGMPLRREIRPLDRPGLRPKALAHFGLDPQWPTVLVTGGSLPRGSTPRSRRRCRPAGAGVRPST